MALLDDDGRPEWILLARFRLLSLTIPIDQSSNKFRARRIVALSAFSQCRRLKAYRAGRQPQVSQA